LGDRLDRGQGTWIQGTRGDRGQDETEDWDTGDMRKQGDMRIQGTRGDSDVQETGRHSFPKI